MSVSAQAFSVTGGDLGIFDAYCVDLDHFIDISNETYSYNADLMSNWTAPGGVGALNTGDSAAWLYNAFAATVADANKAALQVAIWEVLYETAIGPWSATSGAGFSITNNAAVATQANVYLAALGSNTGEATWLRTFDIEERDYTQDRIGPAVPEPGTLLLLGSGIVGLRLRRRKA